jgi:predicted enzyme related to lactoylglutathione lyase
VVNFQGRFVWYELMTTDIEAAKAFYANVVGWDVRDASMSGGAHFLFTAGEALVSGLILLPEEARAKGAKPHWIGYIGVDDMDTVVERIKKLGGRLLFPPTDIPGASRFSVVADPQMATFALIQWLNVRQDLPAALDAPGRVGWYELLADDWRKAFAFYGKLFGWQKVESDADAAGTYQLFSAGGETIGGTFTKPPAQPMPLWLYYFNVEDIETAEKRLQAAGGQVLNGPFEVPNGNWAVQCADPQGAIFALIGKRKRNPIGYFERESRDPSNPPRRRRWSW